MGGFEVDTVATTISGHSAQPHKRFGCGYCKKDFSKRYELSRHWTALAKTCTERVIEFPLSSSQCSRCGKQISESGTGIDSTADHASDFGTSVRIDYLSKGWRRCYPKLLDQEEGDESYEPSDSGYPLGRPTLFLGRYRESESVEWTPKHVEFRHNPNDRKAARKAGTCEAGDAYA